MKNLIISVFLLLLIASCGDEESPTELAPITHTMKGKVINFITDLPVEGVYVSTSPLSRTTRTNSKGQFTLEELEEGEYVIILQKYGYTELSSPIDLNSNTVSSELVFPLIPDSTKNTKPFKPELVSPLDGATISDKKLLFRWFSENIDDKDISFNLYFGTNPNELSVISSDLKNSSFDFEFDFQKDVKYYWKVVSSNLFYTSSSDIFEFQYGINNQPEKPILLKPTMGEVLNTDNVVFNWSGIDPDGDKLLYDIYIGIHKTQLDLYDSNLTSTTYNFGYNLNEVDTYYWRIEAKDQDFSVSSDIFEFKYKDTSTTSSNSIIGYWKLNGNAVDSGPNNYNGLEEGLTYVIDRNGVNNNAPLFNGIPGQLKSLISCSNEIQFSEFFSVSYWIKPSNSLGNNSDNYFDCISKWGGSSFEAASFSLGITNNSKLFLNTYDIKGKIKLFKSDIDIPIERWTHVTLTFQNGLASFYINGDLKLTSADFPIPQYSTVPFSIGARHDNLSAFHGSIDDVIIFSRVLTTQEIKALSSE